MSKFFIHRPVFAAVLSIVIILAGLVTLSALPIAQYPEIAPPTIAVSAVYPGADATVVAETVATPIEQEVNGVENMLYLSSVSANDGTYSLTITFAPGTDLDIAAVQVQNRVARAEARLPEEVTRTGVTTRKRSTQFAVAMNLTSPDGRYDDVFLSNYATLRARDVIARIDGVGDVQIFGAAEYSMRAWLDPDRLQARNLTTSEVVAAIREQNVQVAAGRIGAPPAPEGLAFQYTVTTLGRLEDVEQFENIIVRTDPGGRDVRVGDVARVELGAQTYDMYSQLNGAPSASILVYQLPGANLLEISENIRATMAEIGEAFPEGLEYVVTYDASDVVNASIREIVTTLLIAVALVIFTVWIFLQDIRTTLIPSVTIPVSLIGTFAVLGLLGFSINTLTMFGMVLAIGIVVDDAIVVVENVMRNIDAGLPRREAAIKAMEEVTGPVIATTLVLLAVFVPTAFMGGITGVLFNQFGLTIATTTVFSSINALTLSPALCALLLRKSPERPNPLFRGFNFVLDKSTKGYEKVVGLFVRRLALTALVFLIAVLGAGYGMVTTPTGFVPMEDQGYFMVNVQLPDGASLERTRGVLDDVNTILDETPGVQSTIMLGGYSMLEGAAISNLGSAIVVLDHWDERKSAETSLGGIIGSVRQRFASIQEGIVVAFPMPPIPGLGLTAGFEVQIQDRQAVGLPSLAKTVDGLIEAGNTQSGLTGMYTGFRASVPQLFVDVDREKVKTLDLSLQNVFDTMQAYLGSTYVNDFNRFGRTYQVKVQADSRYRAGVDDIRSLRVRNADGEMIPLDTLVTVEESFGPQVVNRYNLYPAINVKGQPAPGFTSGQAMDLLEDVAKKTLPASAGFEWTGLSYQEREAGSQTGIIFGLAILLVYLVLAAQYEAWSIPFAVILAVPLGMLGAFGALLAAHLDNNVYTQIGLVLLVALVSKNAILIVEFAREKHSEGLSLREAAQTAATLRFRPILMTALSFILGTIPLLIATGAGAASRRVLGLTVFSGMLCATILGVLLTPAVYVIIQGLSERLRRKKNTTGETTA